MGDHLIVLHSAVRACPGYDRHEAPSMLMGGSSLARDTEHGRAVTAQLTRRHRTLEDAIEAGMFALSAAGVTKGIRRQARAACEDYFYNRLSLTPAYAASRSVWGDRRTSVTVLAVTPARPGALVEIEAVAALPEHAR